MWDMDCIWPHEHSGFVRRPHRCWLSPQIPCPVLNRFRRDQHFLFSDIPGSGFVGSLTISLFGTWHESHCSRQRLSTEKLSSRGHSQIGWRDFRRFLGGFFRSEARGIDGFCITFFSRFCVCSSRRMLGGAMLLRTGSHGTGVDLIAPVIMRIDEFTWTSTKFVCDQQCSQSCRLNCLKIYRSRRIKIGLK